MLNMERGTLTMKIRMLENVRPDLPLAKPGTILRAGEEYEAKSNKNGAISGLCANGEYLGVRPGEFVFTEAPNWVRSIWAEVHPQALSGLKDERSSTVCVPTDMEVMPRGCQECALGKPYGCVGDVYCKVLGDYFTGNPPYLKIPCKERPDECPLVEMRSDDSVSISARTEMDSIPENCVECKLGGWNCRGMTKCRILDKFFNENLEPPYKSRTDECPLTKKELPKGNFLAYADLCKMDGEPIWVVYRPDADGEQCKFWALVSIDEDGEVYLRNSLGGCSSYEEAAPDIEAIYSSKEAVQPDMPLGLDVLRSIDLGYDISHMRPVFVKLKETAWPGTGGMSEGYAVVAFEADGEVAKVWAVGCECAVEVRADEYGESWVAYRQEPGREGKV